MKPYKLKTSILAATASCLLMLLTGIAEAGLCDLALKSTRIKQYKSSVVQQVISDPNKLWATYKERYEARKTRFPEDPLNFSVSDLYQDLLDRKIEEIRRAKILLDSTKTPIAKHYAEEVLNELQMVRREGVPYRRLVLALYHASYVQTLLKPSSFFPIAEESIYFVENAPHKTAEQKTDYIAKFALQAFQSGEIERLMNPLQPAVANRLSFFIGASNNVKWSIPRFLVLTDGPLDLNAINRSSGVPIYNVGFPNGDRNLDEYVLPPMAAVEHDLNHALFKAMYDIYIWNVIHQRTEMHVDNVIKMFDAFFAALQRDIESIADPLLLRAVEVLVFDKSHESPGYAHTQFTNDRINQIDETEARNVRSNLLRARWLRVSLADPLMKRARVWLLDYISKSKELSHISRVIAPLGPIDLEPGLFDQFAPK